MTSIIARVAATFAVSAVATAAVAADYSGPKMDLSSVQPEFRIGFLGDEAAQDIIARNECLQDYVEAAFGVPAKMFTFKD
ncbi:MAG: hypothetical protein AAGF74_11855 [Pseudomonadota bacterium]